MRPLIGLPLCLDASGRIRADRVYHYVASAYARALEDAGASVLYLPIQRDACALVARLDGLLVPGGDDLRPPRPYPPDVRFDFVPDEQLAFDRALVEAALEARLPLLGICYGMQLLALARGGALHYDLATDFPAAGAHRLPEKDGRHALAIEKGTRLAEIANGADARVGSRHHQAVSDAGPELRVSARADDGVIEAIEGRGPAFCLGVQWHPETDGGELSRAIFADFVAAARAFSSRT